MSTNYLNLAIGAPRRLAILRAAFEKRSQYSTSKSWRDMRFGNLKEQSGLWGGYNGEGAAREAVWYTQDGQQFRREKFADECKNAHIGHTGWYCDEDGCEKARGVVVNLPHDRFIAGYLMTCNDERVYFGEIFDNERDAARMADEHARVIAENETEYQEKYRAAQTLDEATDTALERLRECLALRNHACFAALRDEARELVETIKGNRFELATNYKGVL